jgi:hypothetical protein
MKQVLVDMHRLKYNPFNGLYSVCINLGKALAAIPLTDMELEYYLPKKDFGIFGRRQNIQNTGPSINITSLVPVNMISGM